MTEVTFNTKSFAEPTDKMFPLALVTGKNVSKKVSNSLSMRAFVNLILIM